MTDEHSSHGDGSIDLYLAGDTGPSGFGVATRNLVRELLDVPDVRLNLRTHDVGFSKVGANSGRQFPDTRFREYLFRNDIVNEDYLVDEPRESAKRETNNLLEELNAEVDEELMIRQWDGDPSDADVWLAIGGPSFGKFIPDGPYSILSTDYNLDIVPGVKPRDDKLSTLLELFNSPLTNTDEEWLRDEIGVGNDKKDLEAWVLNASLADVERTFRNEGEMVRERIISLVEDIETDSGWKAELPKADEVWVPSEWTRQSILNRFPEFKDKVFAFPYGVPMNYEPGLYDHQNCAGEDPNVPHSGRAPHEQPCIGDNKFTFLVISRFYQIKGLYRTIRAYFEAFTTDDNVRLFLKTTSNQQFDFNPGAAIERILHETSYPDTPEVGIGASPMDTQHLYDLMGRSNCFVQASRAECFGIAQFQAAYCRTPVIYTNWSCQEELFDADHDGFFPLDDYEVEPARAEVDYVMYEGPDYYPVDAKWATPSIEGLADKMREVYEMSEEDHKRHAMGAREYVEENFKWSDMIQPRLERLRRVKEVPA